MNFFKEMVWSRDRARIDKLGTGVGNHLSLILRFGYFLSFVLGGRRHSRFFLAVAHFGLWLRRWRAGRFSLVRYLKSCQVTLMQLLSDGPVSDPRELGGVHGRSRGMIPRVIPVYHRVAIKRGDLSVIRFWLSLLGVYRIIEVRGKASFDTITSLGVGRTHKAAYNLGTFLNHIQNVSSVGKRLLKSRSLETEFRFSPRAILTSGANVLGGVGAFWAMAWDASILWDSRLEPIGQAFMDICILTKSVATVELLKHCAKLAHRADDAMDVLNKRVTLRKHTVLGRMVRSLKGFSTLFARRPDDVSDGFTWKRAPFNNFKGNLALGRLHQIPEPAGKVRVVAMATWWVQVILYPLHRILYSLLSTIPQDGTYDQTGPIGPFVEEILKRMSVDRKCHVFSFDLKAATDRFPIWYQIEVLTRLCGRRFAEAWSALLVSIPYYTGGIGSSPRGSALKYGSGQPMGVYSSWAMFSLCHHLLVQQAAFATGYVGWYPWYVLLGDDIVILGEDVAGEYKKLCSDLGVTIGLAKSLVSSNGSFEFAKRFYYKGQDCSPTSVREFWVSLQALPSFSELIARLKGQNPELRLADVIRGAKYGYRSVGKLTQRIVSLGNSRLANLLAILMLPGAPFEQPLPTLLSRTSTAVKPDENLVDTPITERRVKSVARTIGDTLVATSARVTSYFSDLDRYEEHLKGRDPYGVLRYVLSSRIHAARSNQSLIDILGRFGRYLLDGKLNSRGLMSLLGKILPVWRVSKRDVASLPDPFSLDAAGGVLHRSVAVKFLKIRVKLLGLAWKGRPKARISTGGKRSHKRGTSSGPFAKGPKTNR
nr:MAG: putative RNA-dependent RNA polymerase [Mitoviridae sp.]